MKRIFIAAIALLLLFAGCAKEAGTPAPEAGAPGALTISFDFERQSGFSSNQFAVWMEDADGTVVKTLFATEFTAKGGYEKRPSSLTNWVERAVKTGITDADAVAGATPKSGPVSYVWDCTDEDGKAVPPGTYKFFVENTFRVGEGSTAGHVEWGEIEIGGADTETRAQEIGDEFDTISNVKAVYTAQP
ncbi:MAG: DUF2271 domain-containing protein [Firmicutes bacterium]|nr:DUF2271 domain-containing protein [Bacillota bacterium]